MRRIFCLVVISMLLVGCNLSDSGEKDCPIEGTLWEAHSYKYNDGEVLQRPGFYFYLEDNVATDYFFAGETLLFMKSSYELGDGYVFYHGDEHYYTIDGENLTATVEFVDVEDLDEDGDTTDIVTETIYCKANTEVDTSVAVEYTPSPGRQLGYLYSYFK